MPEISPPPDTGTRTVVDVGHILRDLQPDGALAGDHVGVVERRDHRLAGLLGEFGRSAEPLLDRHQFDGRAEVAGGLDLAGGGVVRDHDVRVDAERPCRVGDRLGVVAGRMRQHAAGPDVRVEPGDRGHRAADLERADRLQVLRLEPQPRPGRGQQRACARRTAGSARRRRGSASMLDQLRTPLGLSPAGSGSSARRSIADSGGRRWSRPRRAHRPGRWPRRRCRPAAGCPASTVRFTRASAIGPSSWCWATVPTRPTPGRRPSHRRAGLRQPLGRAVQVEHHQPARRPAEVVHPGDRLLAPVAALLQVDGGGQPAAPRSGWCGRRCPPPPRPPGGDPQRVGRPTAGRHGAGRRSARSPRGRARPRGTSRSMPASVRRTKPPPASARPPGSARRDRPTSTACSATIVAPSARSASAGRTRRWRRSPPPSTRTASPSR